MGRYRCTVCGYIYEPGVPFADLPEDWVCPVCGVDKSQFEPIKEEESRGGKAGSVAAVDAAALTPVTRTYTNGEISVFWQPAKCDHNGNCWRRLPQVFDPKARPWVNIHGADSPTIAKIVEECPTGALSVTWVKKQDK